MKSGGNSHGKYAGKVTAFYMFEKKLYSKNDKKRNRPRFYQVPKGAAKSMDS